MLILYISRHSTHASDQPCAALDIVSFSTTARDLLAPTAVERNACLKASKKNTQAALLIHLPITGINNMTGNTMVYTKSGISPLKSLADARTQYSKPSVKIPEPVAVKEACPLFQGRSYWPCHRNQEIDIGTLL